MVSQSVRFCSRIWFFLIMFGVGIEGGMAMAETLPRFDFAQPQTWLAKTVRRPLADAVSSHI